MDRLGWVFLLFKVGVGKKYMLFIKNINVDNVIRNMFYFENYIIEYFFKFIVVILLFIDLFIFNNFLILYKFFN